MTPSPDPLPLETPRLRLRALREADLERYQAYRGDPLVTSWQGWQQLSRDQARAFLLEMAALPFCTPGRWCQVALADHDSDALLGNVGLRLRDDGAVHVGITLARAAQGRGLATEALQALMAAVFAHTPATRLEAVSDAGNGPALKLLAACGFVAVATLPATFQGEPCVQRHFVRHRQPSLPIHLRPALSTDAAGVAEVLISARRERMPFAPPVRGDDDVRRWVAQQLLPGGGVTVAELHRRVVGVLALARHHGAGWIDQLYVAPGQAGGGIGAALLAHAQAQLGPPLRLYTFQANVHARGFYERQGFKAIAFGDGSGNEEGLPDILFEWRG